MQVCEARAQGRKTLCERAEGGSNRREQRAQQQRTPLSSDRQGAWANRFQSPWRQVMV
jgi:hypothetical protein